MQHQWMKAVRTVTVSAILMSTLLGSSLARDPDSLPSTSGEWSSALSGYAYADAPVAQAQERQALMRDYLKSLGMVQLWEVSVGNEAQEAWYSTVQQVTVILTAKTGGAASLSAQAVDGRVTPQVALAAGLK